MAEATVLVDDAQAVRTITLNRPDKLNSFNEEMHAALRQAFDRRRRRRRARGVLTGAGKGFCAGQDLSTASRAKAARHRTSAPPSIPCGTR